MFADTAFVSDDFNTAFEEFKNHLTEQGMVLPVLSTNMRNQKNIVSVTVQGGYVDYKVKDFIKKLECGSTVVGEIPSLVKIKRHDWATKKCEVLKHVIDSMKKKNNKNIVVLHGAQLKSEDLKSDLINITNKTIVVYPTPKNKQQGIANIQTFIQNDNCILVTRSRYFNGSESSNVIYIEKADGVTSTRSSLMRAVEHLTIIQIINNATINDYTYTGMKEECKFLT